MTPHISTFVSSLEDISIAIKAGATHLILEDARFSIRSTENPESSTFENHINCLKTEAFRQKPNISISFNCDLIVHDHQIPLIKEAIITLKKLNIPHIRIQDIGLLPFIKSNYPSAKIQFAPEIGSHNLIGLKTCIDAGAYGLTFNNELTHHQIQTILSQLTCYSEIQVQGPLLIQYSPRPLLSKLESDQLGTITPHHQYHVIDPDLPKRQFRFFETSHGHFMTAHFHRSLIPLSDQLKQLKLNSWVIDTRRESKEYTELAISTYAAIASHDAPPPIEAIKKLQAFSTLPQKPGFFITNNTNKDWRDTKSKSPNKPPTGLVINVIKKQLITITVHSPLSLNTPITIITPEHKNFNHTITSITTLGGKLLSSSNGHLHVNIPWIKGVTIKSQVYDAIN